MSRLHSELTGLNIHEAFQFIGNLDPGAVGAGLYWLDTSDDPYILRKRNPLNTDWVSIGAGGGGEPVSSAMVLLGTLTPTGTGTASFLDISQEYASLLVDFAVRGSNASPTVSMDLLINQDAVDANYGVIRTTGYSWGVFSGVNFADSNVLEPEVMANNSMASSASFGGLKIPFYTSAWSKILVCTTLERMDGFNDEIRFRESYLNWESVDPITRLDFVLSAGNYTAGSIFKLYGVM